MMPQLVSDGVVTVASCLPVATAQMRISPMRFPAARYWLSGLNVTAWTDGTCEHSWTVLPVWASKTLTDGSVSGAGSYLGPPARYWPVTDAKCFPSGEIADCHDQNWCALIFRIVFLLERSCHCSTPS